MFSKQNEAKIGFTLIYLIDHIPSLFMTKAMKLLYYLDEYSVKETGVPFTWLNYNVWQKGPVTEKLYNFITKDQKTGEGLSKYISVEASVNPHDASQKSYLLGSKISFADNEFTDYEMKLMDRIIKTYGGLPVQKLIDLLHQENTLWHQIVVEKDLEQVFSFMQNRSDHRIPFTDLIRDDVYKQIAYSSALSSKEFAE